MFRFILKSSLIAVLGCIALSVQAATLDTVKARGLLRCGVNPGLKGFAEEINKEWKGFDVDFCRAVASAVFKDNSKVEFVPLTAKRHFDALHSGVVDLLARNTTWTSSRDADGLEFVGVTFYDGQAFMVRKSLGVKSNLELDGYTVCVTNGTTSQLNMKNYFENNGLSYEELSCESFKECRGHFLEGNCNVLTADKYALAVLRASEKEPSTFTILPEVISKEPLALAVREGDSQWADIVRWTLNTLINAEQYGITSQNIEDMKTNQNPDIRRLLGLEGDFDFGKSLGLDRGFAQLIITQNGNYGEIFARNLGEQSGLELERGANANLINGGILYAPPVR